MASRWARLLSTCAKLRHLKCHNRVFRKALLSLSRIRAAEVGVVVNGFDGLTWYSEAGRKRL